MWKANTKVAFGISSNKKGPNWVIARFCTSGIAVRNIGGGMGI